MPGRIGASPGETPISTSPQRKVYAWHRKPATPRATVGTDGRGCTQCYDPTLFFLPPLIHPSYLRNNPSHLPLHGYISTIPVGPCHVPPPGHCHHYRLSYRPAPLPVYPDLDSAPNTLTHQASLIRSPRTYNTS
jgi:hypothetical protein